MNDYKLINKLIKDGSEISKLKLKMIVDLENINLNKIRDINFLFYNLFQERLTVLTASESTHGKLVFGFRIANNHSSILKMQSGKISRELIDRFESQLGELFETSPKILSYIKYSDFKYVLKKFNKNLDKVFGRNINNLNYVPKKMFLKTMKKHERSLKNYLLQDSFLITFYHMSLFKKIEIVKFFKEEFSIILSKTPYSFSLFIYSFEDRIFEIIEMFRDTISKILVNSPGIIQDLKKETIVKFVEMFKPEFEQIFTEDCFILNYINFSCQKQVAEMFPSVSWF